MKNKIPEKYKVRKPMPEKRKSLLKGLAFGFLAGGIATLVAVGVVGCAMQGSEAKEEPKTSVVKARQADTLADLANHNFIFNTSITGSISISAYLNFTYEGAGDTYTRFYYNQTSSYPKKWYIMFGSPVGGSGNITVWHQDNGWANSSYRYVSVSGGNDSTTSNLVTFFNNNATVNDPVIASSSEEASSDVSSTETTFEAVDHGSLVTFGSNPFTAWAVNHGNDENAVNYEGGAPWLLYTGSPTGDTPTLTDVDVQDFVIGKFSVYGNPEVVYDTIRIVTASVTTDHAFIGSGGEAFQVTQEQYNNGAFYIGRIYYRNFTTGDSVNVYSSGLQPATLNGSTVNAISAPVWLNEGFRKILVEDPNPTIIVRGYEASVGWWLENNALSSSASVATLVLGDGSTGVFGLIASAFTAWGSVFGIAIIPGLTLGTLMFVPLVVLIIFAIIKLLNK